MLVNTLLTCSSVTSMIAMANGNTPGFEQLEDGFVQIGHFSLCHMIDKYELKDEWPVIDRMPNCYGVCDTPQQFIRRYKKTLSKSKRKFIVSFTEISKDKQSPSGGWRWHKWGPYIGTQKPTGCEYIYDEPKIERVFCYHILELN
jgi:hypothetical protein